MFERITVKSYVNREYTGEYADIEFDTYIDNRGKEEIEDVRTKVHYYEAGEGEPMILVHGIGQSLYTWRKNFDELAKDFHVYAIDLLGHGFSGKPQMSYSIEEFALSIEAFMNVKGISAANFCAFGESAAYVLDFAMHNVERARKLIFISPVISAGAASILKGRGIVSAFGGIAGKMMLSSAVVRSTLNDCYFDRTLVTDNVVEEYFAGLADKDFKMIAKACVANFMDAEVVANIYYIKSPMLIISGIDDKMTGGKDSEFLKLTFENASSMIVRNCGYLIHEEKPEKVNEAIVQFCK
ncbi:MAG: alpha/beta hydrolase [Christensenellaceae bacterium]